MKADVRYALPISDQTAKFLRLELTTEQAILTEIYIEALLVGEKLADQVWEAWNGR